MQTGMAGALAASLVFCAAGCGKRPTPSTPEPVEPAGVVKITIHVKDMTKALNIT